VKRSAFPWVIAGTEVLAFAAWHVAGLILASAGLSAAYLASLRLHPRTRHRRCGGTGEVRGAVFTWTHRKCPRCSGGRLVRWGAGQWGSGPARSEYARAKEARAKAREEHRWR
jgi:hypothetical protein